MNLAELKPADAVELDYDTIREAIREVAWNAVGIPYSPEAPLTRQAREMALGVPMTTEFDLGGYRAQGFARGIIYCRIGDWTTVYSIMW